MKLGSLEDDQNLFRVVTLGESSVGKTSIINFLSKKVFHGDEQPTVGATFFLYDELINGIKIEMQIWDTAGQEKYRSLSPIYCRDATAALICFDITNHNSFEKIDEWVQLLSSSSGCNTIIVLVATKMDLIDQAQISDEEMLAYSSSNNHLLFKTSAKTGEGVDELFSSIAKEIIKRGFVKEPSVESRQIKSQDEPKGCC